MNIQEITNKVEAVLERADEALYIHTIVEQAMVSKDDATNALKRLAAQGLVDFTPAQGRWGNRYALVRSAKPVTTEAQRQEQAVNRLEEALAEEGLKVPDTPEGMTQALLDARDDLPEGVKQALNEVDLDMSAICAESLVVDRAEKPIAPPNPDAVDALNILTQKVTHTRIIVKLLTCGRSREVLTESEADELDWMLLYGLQAIEEAAAAVNAVIRGGRVSA